MASRELKKSTTRALSSRYRSLGEDEVDAGRVSHICEPLKETVGFLPMRKQRRRSAVQ